jgi:Ca-activated chloride channel family protein
MGDWPLLRNLMPGYSRWRHHTRFMLLGLAFGSGVLAVMHLRKPGDSGGVSRKGIDVVFALDVSRSMLATDEAPSRLQRAQQLLQKLLNQLPNDRVGLVVFAGQAYLQMPLTTDHGAASMYISTASPDAVPSQGTVVSEALRRSAQSFNAAERRFKAVVLVSDGEDHDEAAITTARELAEQGMMINTVGMGSAEGSRIPDATASGGYKLDRNGQIVYSKLNEQLLQNIAKATNGVYVNLDDADTAVEAIVQQLSQIEKKAYGDISLVNFKTFYWIFAGFMLLLLLIEPFIAGRKLVKA